MASPIALLLTLAQAAAGLEAPSHASGQRPELGPVQKLRVLTSDASQIRVGLTPTAFNADGTLRLEYDTAAAHNHGRVEITASARFEVVLASGATLVALDPGAPVTFARSAGEIGVSAPQPLGSFPGPLRVRSASDAVVVVNSIRRLNRLLPLVGGSFQLTPAPYRGELEVRASEADGGALRVVNVVPIEPYVAGVVVNESLASFHVEAQKAQAVAARGYALANVGRFASRGFDVDDSTLSQVYRGQSSETDTALAAAQGTEGLVALRDGRILAALYSSSMGGRTEDNEWIFPSGGLPGTNADPALRSIHDADGPPRHDLTTDAGVLAFYGGVWPDAFEVNPATGQPLTAQHRWTRTRTAAEMLARLKDPSRPWGVPASASRIDELLVTLRGSSGRAMRVVVRGDWGETAISGWSDLRALASLAGVTPGGTSESSAPNCPSTLAVARDGSGAVARVTFYGGGFGHNVGMSQYGAQGRALRGQDFSRILAEYYSGSQLGSAPMLLQAAAAFTTVVRAGRIPTLVVENDDLEALAIEIDGRSFVMPLRRGEERLVDLIDYVSAGATRLRFRPIGNGAAVAYIRREPDARERPRP